MSRITAMLKSSIIRHVCKKTSYHQICLRRHVSSDSSNIVNRMPSGAWDSHMHVTSPLYPLAQSAAYKPSLHSLDHAMKFEKSIGIQNIVLVQPSIYGNDNSCLLDALKEIGPEHGRGVVAFDPDSVDSDTLRQWHQLGVRGVRLNFKSTKVSFTQESLRHTLQKYAEVVRPLDWAIELFIDLQAVPLLRSSIQELGVKFCIAHFGAPDMKSWPTYPSKPLELPGLRALVDLLSESDNLWVKASGAYRFDPSEDMYGIEAIAKLLLSVAEKQIVFASDWPHTRFEGLDVKPLAKKCLDWAEERDAKDLVFRDNAAKLWSVGS